MNRRHFLSSLSAGALLAGLPDIVLAAGNTPTYQRLLILVELKGGNDGLNTVVPYADPRYAQYRPRLALARDTLPQLTDRLALHPKLSPLMPLWQQGELAVLQGIGYPQPNLSHFRSIEIWDTASASNDYLSDGWLTRQFKAAQPPRSFAADGVILDSQTLGPLAGGSRAIILGGGQTLRPMADPAMSGNGNAALAHLMQTEADLSAAANGLHFQPVDSDFPKHTFGNDMRRAAELIAGNSQVAVIRVSHGSFDTHTNQLATQGRLLGELAEGLVALREALTRLGRWQDTLVLTYAEFGRRVAENQSGGTDHGTANVHFALGGRVHGGLHGPVPDLGDLDGGNLRFALDFRQVYATVIDRWWGGNSQAALDGRFAPIAFV